MPAYRPLKQYDYTGCIILANNLAQTKYMLFDRTLWRKSTLLYFQ